MLGIQFSVKIFCFESILEVNETSQEFLEGLEKKSIMLMNTKIYLDSYTKESPIEFNELDLGTWI